MVAVKMAATRRPQVLASARGLPCCAIPTHRQDTTRRDSTRRDSTRGRLLPSWAVLAGSRWQVREGGRIAPGLGWDRVGLGWDEIRNGRTETKPRQVSPAAGKWEMGNHQGDRPHVRWAQSHFCPLHRRPQVVESQTRLFIFPSPRAAQVQRTWRRVHRTCPRHVRRGQLDAARGDRNKCVPPSIRQGLHGYSVLHSTMRAV